MDFRVEIAPRAFNDLDAIATYIEQQSGFEEAEKWFNAMIRTIASLAHMPGRCPIAAESDELGREIRVLLHGKRKRLYKVYFSVCDAPAEMIVRILHVRHWAQRALEADELQEVVQEEGEPDDRSQ